MIMDSLTNSKLTMELTFSFIKEDRHLIKSSPLKRQQVRHQMETLSFLMNLPMATKTMIESLKMKMIHETQSLMIMDLLNNGLKAERTLASCLDLRFTYRAKVMITPDISRHIQFIIRLCLEILKDFKLKMHLAKSSQMATSKMISKLKMKKTMEQSTRIISNLTPR